jgi:2-polyprenyl-6-hydroxyphenyl methylase/3-demethylubiquinone-9 3-methyltransferase
VISLEVVEHVYAPRSFAATIFDLLEPGGIAVLSTPYHGYLKNLAIAALNGFDKHVNPLWDYGHIKFWSQRTLS